jgi:hypothetical protein
MLCLSLINFTCPYLEPSPALHIHEWTSSSSLVLCSDTPISPRLFMFADLVSCFFGFNVILNRLPIGSCIIVRVPPHLHVISDAAFKREAETGYSLRGALFFRGGGRPAETITGARTSVHILDWACKTQRYVTRSTFAAEVLSSGDSVDQGISVGQMLSEADHGAMTATQDRERCMNGGFVPLSLSIDAKSVYAAVAATLIKTRADNSLLCQVQYLRELVDRQKTVFDWA